MPKTHTLTIVLSASAYAKLVAVSDEVFPGRQRSFVASSLLRGSLDSHYSAIAVTRGWTEGLAPSGRTAAATMENYLVCARLRAERAKESAKILKSLPKPDLDSLSFDD